jgi:hypothetical protein
MHQSSGKGVAGAHRIGDLHFKAADVQAAFVSGHQQAAAISRGSRKPASDHTKRASCRPTLLSADGRIPNKRMISGSSSWFSLTTVGQLHRFRQHLGR